MKIFGIVFGIAGVLVSIDGFANSVTDIQFGIGVTGIAIAGIGLTLYFLSQIKDALDFQNYLAEKEKKD